MENKERLKKLTEARGIMSQVIRDFSDTDVLWFKNLLQSAGCLDSCLMCLKKEIK